jgi:hypothetical protein
MLLVEKPVKIRKDNLYVLCDGYYQRELIMDLDTSKVFIIVDFYRNKQVFTTKKYDVGICGDCDVNKLIEDLHITIQNERQ